MKGNHYSRGGLLTGMISVLFTIQAFAATEGSITIGGVVLPVSDLVITSEAGFDQLDLTGGTADQTVGVVNERNNDPDGYIVTLRSANASAAGSDQARLKGAGAKNESFVAYSIKYGAPSAEAEVHLDSGGSAVVTSASGPTSDSGSLKQLKITVPAASRLNADIYSDTLTLTISAK